MNVSLKWLGTLVDIKGLDPEEMAETLTVDGIPVEHVIYPGKGIQGVVTGKILSIEKHPDADHLVVCQLDCAKGAPIQIVTGASNVEVGQIVPSHWMGRMYRLSTMRRLRGDFLAVTRRSRRENSAVSCRMA